MKNKELLPCPFCGGESLKVEGKKHNLYRVNGYDVRHITVSVRCNKCSARGPATGSKITAYIANGKRVPEHSMYECELREIVKEKWNSRANTITVGNGENYEVTHNDNI